jgi:hypothetical protein
MRTMAKETHIKTDKKTVGGWGAWELRKLLLNNLSSTTKQRMKTDILLSISKLTAPSAVNPLIKYLRATDSGSRFINLSRKTISNQSAFGPSVSFTLPLCLRGYCAQRFRISGAGAKGPPFRPPLLATRFWMVLQPILTVIIRRALDGPLILGRGPGAVGVRVGWAELTLRSIV